MELKIKEMNSCIAKKGKKFKTKKKWVEKCEECESRSHWTFCLMIGIH